MNRAFITLYFLLVVSVILIGWGLNQFWESVAPEQGPSVETQVLFQVIERDLLAQQVSDYAEAARQMSAQLTINLELLPLGDLARSAALHELQTGKILAVTSDNKIIWYKRLAQTDQVIMVSIPIKDERESPVQRVLLLVFYLCIALVIYFWVWPLSRDSKKLERQTRTFGKDGVPDTLKISPTSTLYPLAQAFNHMAQRLRELIASHRDMTNAVSHELRTPLARIKFALAMIEEKKMDEKSRRQLRSVEQDVAEMESLISALLAYAGFEQKTQQLNQTQGYMRDLLDELQLRFARQCQDHLQLEIFDTTDNAVFLCEWKLMETVLQNFINNAARHAKGRIRIELMQTPGEYIIAVEDDGPGIPADERERVFDSFVRLYYAEQDGDQRSGNSATGGFGLGLAIVKRIMQWHRGSAEFVEPKTLGGARAQIRWPKSHR